MTRVELATVIESVDFHGDTRMVIRAIVERGKFRPLDPLPSQWREGQELNLEVRATTETPANSNEHPSGSSEFALDSEDDSDWSDIERVWAECNVNSGKPRPRRDELHDRD
jgi:hypothetical protein